LNFGRFLKDQTMDERLAYLKRASGLDARHSFFVLPLSQHGDLQDFVAKYVKSFSYLIVLNL
jgi:hypothetical protein